MKWTNWYLLPIIALVVVSGVFFIVLNEQERMNTPRTFEKQTIVKKAEPTFTPMVEAHASTVENEQLANMRRACELAVQEVPGKVREVERERRNGIFFYEVDILTDDRREVQVWVDVEREVVDVVQEYPYAGPLFEEMTIDVFEALDIAQKEGIGEVVEFKLKTSEGRTYYKITMRTPSLKTKMKINAIDGSIIELSTERKS